MNERLAIHLRARHVADLECAEGGALLLTYRGDARPGVDALSLSLPVRAEPYPHNPTRTFLDWLLPEQQVRATMSARIHADPSDTFALLAEYGRECAGAIHFVSDGSRDAAPDITWIDAEEFARRLAELSTHPFLSLGDDDFELSLGGVQEKALVVLDGDRVGIPRHGAVSTHIVKPDISDRLRSALAEHLAMQLAAAVGVPAADTELRAVGGRWVLLVRRFDRLLSASGSLERAHAETMAQALGVAPTAKYEVRGGPGVGAMADLIRASSADVARDLQRLTRLIVFNALIGNADAHVGNFGLIHYENRATRLAPAYDLVPVRAVLGADPKGYAMRLGGTYEFGSLDEARMLALGRELGVAPRGVAAIWRELAAAMPTAAVTLESELQGGLALGDDDVARVRAIVADIVGRCA